MSSGVGVWISNGAFEDPDVLNAALSFAIEAKGLSHPNSVKPLSFSGGQFGCR
jgi:hypothetical protein